MKETRRLPGTIIFLAILALCALFLLNAPFLAISQIAVTGNGTVSDEEILSAGGLAVGQNFFSLSGKKAHEGISKLPLIAQASITKNFPDKVTVTVRERISRAYVAMPSRNVFLLVDEEGYVLSALPAMTEELPLVSGVSFDSFMIGESLDEYIDANFSRVIVFASLLNKYGLDIVSKIDLSNSANVILSLGDVTVHFGQLTELDKKVQDLVSMVDRLPEKANGLLDMSVSGQMPVFKSFQ